MANDGGELVDRRKIRTRLEAGEVFGREGIVANGRRIGARLSKAEEREYDLLTEELTAEEITGGLIHFIDI